MGGEGLSQFVQDAHLLGRTLSFGKVLSVFQRQGNLFSHSFDQSHLAGAPVAPTILLQDAQRADNTVVEFEGRDQGAFFRFGRDHGDSFPTRQGLINAGHGDGLGWHHVNAVVKVCLRPVGCGQAVPCSGAVFTVEHFQLTDLDLVSL